MKQLFSELLLLRIRSTPLYAQRTIWWNEVTCSELPNLTTKNPGYPVKLEFRINMNGMLVYTCSCSISLFIVYLIVKIVFVFIWTFDLIKQPISVGGGQGFSWTLGECTLLRHYFSKKKPKNKKNILNIFLQELGNLEKITSKLFHESKKTVPIQESLTHTVELNPENQWGNRKSMTI